MGYNARNDEIRDNITRMQRDWQAQRDALATVRRFNTILSAKGYVWFWPKIAAALTAKHHWLIINCDSCGTVTDLDMTMKPRDPEASIRVALRDVQCPRCNGHGRPRIIRDRKEWIACVLGLWIAVSPWVLGFQHTVAMFINLAVGLSIAYLALLDLWLTHYGQSTEKA